MNTLGKTTKLFSKNKLVFAFAMVMAFSIFATTASAQSNNRSYFDVEKPSSSQQCEGGEWVIVREYSWRHGIKRISKWIPNYQKLGFRTYQQCINYTSTPKPQSKDDCRRFEWRDLGFRNSSDCRKYLKLHPGTGYGGNSFNTTNSNDEDDD